MKIKLDKDILLECKQFAEDVYESCREKYEKRNQNNKTLIIQQIIEGKFAEWGVYTFYRNRNLQCSEPDHQIYGKRKKSFAADLELLNYKIHVKSQNKESMDRYGKSWLFQLEDPLFSKATNKDIVVFCSVDLKKLTVTIEYRQQFKKLKFSPPKLKKFLGIKLAVYLDQQEGYEPCS